MTTSCLFRPQLKCLVENGPTVIGCKITIVSEKRSGIFGPDDKGCPDRFEVAIDALGGPVEMVLVFDYSHPYSAPDIIVVRDGFSESHGEDYIDYYALESLKLWNLGDASALTRVMKEVMVLRTKRNLGLVKNLVLPSIQVLKEFNEMFGFVPFDVAPNVDGTVCFKYTHKLDYAKDNGGSIPVCFITWKLDPSKPDEPTETKVTLFNVSEAMKTALSGLTVSNYNCATSFKAWLASVDEKFKRTVSKVNSRKEYLREFSKVFNSPLYFNPPKYNVIAFGISEPTYHNPSILKITFTEGFPTDPPVLTLISSKHLRGAVPIQATYKEFPYSPRWLPSELASRIKSFISEEYAKFVAICERKGEQYRYFS